NGDRLREPDRAAVARRHHEHVHRLLLALGHEGARQAEQRREDERTPEQAERRQLLVLVQRRLAAGTAADVRERGHDEVEDRERREDEEQHRGKRLLRPQLEQEVLARQRSDVADIAHWPTSGWTLTPSPGIS